MGNGVSYGDCDSRLGSRTYDAKLVEIYKVPDEMELSLPPRSTETDDDEDVVFKLVPPTQPATVTPTQPAAVQYPCSICHAEVLDKHDALLCDTCSQWCHLPCSDISRMEYRRLKQSDDEFILSCPVHAQLPESDSSSTGDESDVSEEWEAPVQMPVAEPVQEGGRPVRHKKPPEFLGVNSN